MIEEENNIKQEKLNLEWGSDSTVDNSTPEPKEEPVQISAIPPISEAFDEFTKNSENTQNSEEAPKTEEPAEQKEETVQLSNGTIPQKATHLAYPLKTDLSTTVSKEQVENNKTVQEKTVLSEPSAEIEEPEKKVVKTKTTSIFRQTEKKVNNTTPSIGKALQQARKDKALEIIDVAEKTKINRDIIEKIEADNFDAAPAPVYTRGYVKKLAEVYGLNVDNIVNQYNEMITGERKKKPVESKQEAIPTLIDDLESEFSLGPAGVQPTLVSHKSSGGVIKKVAIVALIIIAVFFVKNLLSGNEDLIEEKPVETVELTDSKIAPIIGMKDIERYSGKPEIKTLKLEIPKNKIK